MAVALLALMAVAVSFPARVYANPEGGIVSAGQATITVRPAIVDVHQQSDKAVIDWRSFDIDNGETTQFHQPNAAAIALNRVHSSQASVINGALKANGNVIVVNQNGVLFGRNARVDVNGLVATTADIDNDHFMSQSKLNFDKPGNPNAAIVNQGQITARESGLVGFVAPSVENDGVIAARLGRVHLASGDKATVDFYGDGLMEVAVSDDVRHQLVKNTGNISADGGTVALTAAAGNRILASAIEVGGSVSAQTVSTRNGRIVIAGLTANDHGVAGTVRVSGAVTAASTVGGKKGGSIRITGDKIRLAGSAVVDASGHAGGGDITIGGDYQGKGSTPTASQLVVERGASILNDATEVGNGGRTILWSDGATDFAGSISNRGGHSGGNGGFVEVSGKQLLGYRGTVDTRAPYGMVGTLLLDPANLTISNLADSNVTAGTPFDSTGAATSNLNIGTLVAALGSSNVVVSTAGGTGGSGDVTFVDPLNWSTGFGLTVNADRHIFVNAAITNSGSGYLTLNANTAGSNITVAAPINMGGNLTLSAAQDVLINNALTSGGLLSLTATSRDITANAAGVLTTTGALTTTSGRDTSFGANATAGGDVTVSAGRNITVAASRTLANGAASNMTLLAAGGSTAGTGNLNLTGNLSVGTGSLTLLSGINGTRPSWTATATNLVRQGATFGAVNISGFLNLAINRVLNSSGVANLTANNTSGTIAVGATGSVSGTNVAFNSTLNTTINGAVNATGTLGYTTGQDLVIASGATSASTGNTTVNATRDVLLNGSLSTSATLGGTVSRDIIMTSTGSLSSTAAMTLAARDIVLGNVNSGGNISVTATRDLTTLAGTTITPASAGSLSLQAAGGSATGTGNLTLNGALNAGTGALTLVSGINGTRPSWTATGTNLLRQGATFGAVSISGLLNLVIDRDLNSTGNVTLNNSQTGGTITLNNTRTISGTAITTNSNLDTVINGTLNASTTLAMTSGRDLTIGATGVTSSGSTTTATVAQDMYLNGTLQSAAGFTEAVTRDILMGAAGVLDTVGAITLGGRDIILANVTSGGSIAATATRDLTTRAATTITTGPTGSLTLYAANNVVTGTGNLTIGGNLNVGTGAVTLTSGANGTRPNYTMTATNFTPQSTFGAITINGFLDTFINRDIASTGGNSISITSFRDLTLGGGYTLTPGSSGALTLRAANAAVGGTGNLYINGKLDAGSGTVTLLSGVNGTRPNYTMNSSNFTRQGANWGIISINGFQDTIIDTDLNSSSNIGINSYGDITVNALRTVTSGNGGGISLTAANNVVTGSGNLNLNGVLQNGTGGLTLTTGANGTRPSLTMDGTNIQRIGASYGAITINGFLDTFVNDNLISNSNVSITSFRDLTLNALNSITTGTGGRSLTLRAANNVVGGTGALYLNGTMSVGSGGLTFLSGTNGTRPDFTFTTANVVPNSTNFGAISVTGFQDIVIDRDMPSTSNVLFNAYGDLTIAMGRSVTTGSTGSLTLRAANNVVTGAGNLYLNGVIGAGSGGLNLSSGINGARPDWTATSTNLLQQGANFGVVNIQGFNDLTIDTDITGTTGVTMLAYRDLNINAGRTVTSAANGTLSLRAAGGNTSGTGRLNILGNLGSGTGALTLYSGTNAGRPTFTANSTTLDRVGATFGNVDIRGFQNIIVDRELNSTGTVSFSSNALTTLQNNVSTSGTGTITFSNAVVIGEGASPIVSTNNRNITFSSTIDDTVGGAADNLTVDAGTATATFSGAVNGIGLNATANVLTFAPTSIGATRALQDVALTSTAAFAPPSITANQILVRTTGPTANLTIGAGRVLTASSAGDAIVLAAGQNFINNNGVGALVRPGGGRYIIYSTAPGSDTVGGLTYDERRFSCSFAAAGTCAYNATTNSTPLVPGIGNVFLYSMTPIVLVVVPQSIGNITYGDAAPNLTNYAYVPFTLASGYLNADDFANDVITGSINGQTNYTQGSGVGNYNISYLSGELVSSLGYGFDYQTLPNAFSVLPRHVTVDLTGTAGKIYDGTATATLSGANYTINNIYSGDLLTLGVSNSGVTYNDKNVGTGKTVTANGLSLTGAVAANYVLDNSSAVAGVGTITARALNVTGLSPNKVYDGTTTSSATLGDNRVGGDVLTLGYGTASFSDKNAGTGKTVTINGITLGGADAGNYSFNTSATTTANITPRALTISATGINKIYNGTNVGTVTLGDDRVGGDVLTLGYGSALFGNKNVGNGKALNVSGITLGGADAGNYSFNATAATTADITPRALAIGAIGVNRVYDGTDVATVTLVDNRVGGDVLTLGYGTAFFDNKNVGNGKTVNVSGMTLGGADSGNYTFNTSGSTTANITPRVLVISATGIDRVYDGTNIGAVTLGDDRVGGDVLTLGYGSALFGNKNVGNGKALNVSGITLGGADSGNYSFNSTAATTANITPRALTVTAAGIDRVYDGTNIGTVTLGDDRVGGDVLILGYGSAVFGDKNVGSGKGLNVSGITLGGADSANYSFNTTAATSADITPRALTVSATGINKVYDGTNIGTVTLGDDRVGGDVLILGYGTALFGNKNVGNGKALNVSGIALSGVDAGNYSFNTTAATTADITPRALTVGASGINRVYDGSNVAGITLNDDRVGGDALSLTYASALFPDKQVGNGRTITVSGINVTGADAANYTFNTSTTTTANITPYALIVSASGHSKTYDGNALASATLSDNRVGGDVLSITYGSALFPDKNAGVGRTITVNGINVTGADAGNYTFNTSATTTADINKATLTVTAADQNIVYGTVVPGTTLSYLGFVGSEGVGDLATAPTVNSGVSGIVNAGTYTNNYTASGGVDGNYSFVYVPGTLTVGKKTLTVTANTQTVTYGTIVPAGTLSYSGFIAGEDETDLGSLPIVNSANSGIVNAGTYANNYTVSGGSSGNYDFSYFNGNLVVTKKDLNVTAGNHSITYGQSVPAGTITYSGFIAGEDATDLDVLPTVVSGVSGVVNAGTYTNNYTVSGGTDNNYTYHYAPGTLTVTPAGLNITVNNQSVTYGTVVPGTTITYTGFVNGDNEFDLDVLPTISSAQSGIVGAGTYTGNYTANGAVSANYTFNYVDGNLVVNKKALNVTADNRTVTYGTAVPASALSYSGFIAGEDVTYLASAPILSSGQSGIVNAGTYAGNYTISGGAADNYYFNFTPGDLTVTARTLTVSALPQTVVYGTAVPVGSISYSGFAAGEDATFLAVAPTLSSANSGIVNAGTYVNNYTIGGGVSSNYTFVYAPADLVVTKRPLNVTANGRTITYGTAVPGTSLSYSGFLAGQDATFLDVLPTITSGQTGTVNAGTYVNNYVASGGADTNYSFVYTPGTLTVNRAALTISASNVNKVYGSGNTFSGYNISGLQLGETVGGVTLATNASTSTGGHWNVGTWNVSASNAVGGTFDPANYTIGYLGGTMVVTPRVLTAIAVGGDRVYNGTDLANVTLSDNRAVGDAISLTYADARFPDKNAGVNRTVFVSGISMLGADAANYSLAGTTALGTATITPRVLTITASALDKVQDGNALATVSFTDNRLAGDVLAVGYASALFPDAGLGNYRTVTISGITLTGVDGGNYSVTPSATAVASIYAAGTTPPPPIPAVNPPPTVVKVSQDTGSVMVTTTDDGIFATPSTGYQLIYLPYDAPSENRWRNKPLRAGVGGVPIVEPTAWYRWVRLDAHEDSSQADI